MVLFLVKPFNNPLGKHLFGRNLRSVVCRNDRRAMQTAMNVMI